jgi:hypothetical protein
MEPKLKAKELVKRYADFNSSILQMMSGKYSNEIAKQCALIAVDEIIKEYSTLPHFGELYLENIEYYQEVKQEIELL